MGIYQKLKTSIEEKRGVSLVTITKAESTEASDQQLIASKAIIWADGRVYSEFDLFEKLKDPILENVFEAYNERKPKTYTTDYNGLKLEYYVEVFPPPNHLIIAGAGHVAKPIVEIGKMVGFTVTVVDDRADFAKKEYFTQADEVICTPFVTFFKEFETDSDTYVLLVTRGHKHDVSILPELFHKTLSYIGMIGSRRRISGVFSQLKEEFPEQTFDNIYAPIGLDIGAQTPEEIGVSIMAEVLKVKNKKSGLSLREEVPFFIAKQGGEKDE